MIDVSAWAWPQTFMLGWFIGGLIVEIRGSHRLAKRRNRLDLLGIMVCLDIIWVLMPVVALHFGGFWS